MLELFLTFAKIGVMTFGGGVAMLPILQREVVENHSWASEEEMMDYYALGQCTPGIIAVNVATFIGYKKKGIPGGIVATLGVIFPSVVIILLLAGLIGSCSDIPTVRSAFAGVRVCVCVLVLNATVKLTKKAVIDIPTALLFAGAAAGSYILGVSPVVCVIVSAAAGIVLRTLKEKKNSESRGKGEKKQ